MAAIFFAAVREYIYIYVVFTHTKSFFFLPLTIIGFPCVQSQQHSNGRFPYGNESC